MSTSSTPFMVLMMVVFAVFCQLVMCADEKVHGSNLNAQQLQYAMENPMTAFKRFYSWEDSKRAASIETEEGMRAKRKQFYAWAGKRSAPSQFNEESDGSERPSFEKRKQFYAWAGK